MESSVEVLADVNSLVDRAQAIVCEKLQTAIAQRGQATIALSGGSTPKPLYQKLAQQDLPWEKIHIFWGDERYVPATHPDSNEGMARQAWLNQVPIPTQNIHPVPTHFTDPSEAASAYDQTLHTFFGTEGTPAFDVVLLGLGDDGHTASLFPHTDVLNLCDRLIGVGYRGSDPRITFTIGLINQAQCALFLVAGQSKQNALNAIFAKEGNAFEYPARFIKPQGEVLWLLDTSAATGLNLK